MTKQPLFTGSLLMLLAVVAGAIGSHALAPSLTDQQLNSYTLAYQFQIYHALGILLLFAIQKKLSILIPYYLFLLGIILFCGSIYMITYGHIAENESLIGFFRKVTPVGGISFMLGWVVLMVKALR